MWMCLANCLNELCVCVCVCVCVLEGTKMDISLSRALGVSSSHGRPAAAVDRISAGLHAILFSSPSSPLAGPQ